MEKTKCPKTTILKFTDDEYIQKRFDKLPLEVIYSSPYRTVYKCFDNCAGIERAWNEIPRSIFSDRDYNIFEQNMEVLCTLENDHVVKYYGYFIFQSTKNSQPMVVYICDLMSGGNLREIFMNAEHPLPPKFLSGVLRQTLEGANAFLNAQINKINIKKKAKIPLSLRMTWLSPSAIYLDGTGGVAKIGDMALPLSMKIKISKLQSEKMYYCPPIEEREWEEMAENGIIEDGSDLKSERKSCNLGCMFKDVVNGSHIDEKLEDGVKQTRSTLGGNKNDEPIRPSLLDVKMRKQSKSISTIICSKSLYKYHCYKSLVFSFGLTALGTIIRHRPYDKMPIKTVEEMKTSGLPPPELEELRNLCDDANRDKNEIPPEYKGWASLIERCLRSDYTKRPAIERLLKMEPLALNTCFLRGPKKTRKQIVFLNLTIKSCGDDVKIRYPFDIFGDTTESVAEALKLVYDINGCYFDQLKNDIERQLTISRLIHVASEE